MQTCHPNRHAGSVSRAVDGSNFDYLKREERENEDALITGGLSAICG